MTPAARGGAAVRAWVALVLGCVACGGLSGKVTDASASVYLREDTDKTRVWSPRARVAGTVNDALTVEGAYAMDAWTSASIDIRTSATPVVHELRHEANGGVGYTRDNLTLSGSYRYSTENDYWSHGGVVTGALDLAQNNTNLALSLFGAHDTVGRAGDAQWKRPLDSAGGRFSWTQVLSERSLIQGSWETTFFHGYQASPYRWVAIGGDNGLCASDAPDCVPELTPEERYRHALGVRYRYALHPRISAGLGYRFYFDSWSVQSHTVEPDVTYRLGAHGELSLAYRYYTQGEASFYQPRYAEASESRYFTRDRKLSAMWSQTIAATYNQRWAFADDRYALTWALRASGTQYRYLAYVGLSRVEALELTALLGFEHP